IDEIDTGIHYSRLKSFWRSILTFADAYNVQIFATSHNSECLQYFKETLEETDMQKFQERARILSIKDIQEKPKVYTYIFPEFQNCIDINLEMR
ncbi:MAG: ATP-binding protein, partial [Leptospiraceae bacterium]|nr:ATP-binding protein [Leptospiraceae bacterium]